MTTIAWFVVAAIAEIAGCFAAWAVLRLDRSPWWLLPGALALALFAFALTRVETDYAGRAYAAYGGIYIAAALVWLWLAEGRMPDRWDITGAALAVAGTFSCGGRAAERGGDGVGRRHAPFGAGRRIVQSQPPPGAACAGLSLCQYPMRRLAMLPTLFLSHGSPMIALQDSPARRFLVDYGRALPRPKAILVASAHFETPMPVVVTDPAPEMIYDFGNFDPRLFEMVYPAAGAPDLAMAVAQRLQAAGLSPRITPKRGYDHGTWIPLALMYPDADIPVVQVSIQPQADPAHHLAVGRALAGLAAEDVLVIGSGSLTHNLNEVFDRRRGGIRPLDGPIDPWATAFSDWFAGKIADNDVTSLVDYRALAPEAVRNHPHDDHLLPLYVALGAAGEGARPERIHTSGQHGSLMMDAYAWWPKAETSRAAA